MTSLDRRSALSSPVRTLLAVAPFSLVTAVHVGSKLLDSPGWDVATKPLLMPTLALLLLLLGQHLSRTSQGLMLGGLLLSWIGDVTIENLVVGLSFFLLAHLCYIALFLSTFDRRVSWWGLLAVPWFVLLLAALGPELGGFFVPVSIYGLVLGAMAVAATRGNRWTIAGGVLFVLSDSLLAFRLFTSQLQGQLDDALIMTLYIGAQALLTVGVLRRDAERPGGRSARA